MEQNSRLITPEEFNTITNLYKKNQERLLLYSEVLLWWNSKLNLVSRDVSRETILEHIKHSLYITLFKEFNRTKHVIDTGSGGGLPALPLALCRNEADFLINDIVTKKIFAVKDIINKLALKNTVRAEANDIKNVALNGELIITKHAFKVNQLVEYLGDKDWNTIIFLKGYKEAIAESKTLNPAKFNLEVIKLDAPFMPSFYDGKGAVKLTKRYE